MNESFFFDAEISPPLILQKFELRSEQEYERDFFAEKSALKYIEKISKLFDGHIYLIIAGQDIAPENKLRSKKGVLWDAKELRSLDNRSCEVGVSGGCTRLVSLVNLDKFNYESTEDLVLNWVFGLLVLTNIDIDTLSNIVSNWVSKEHDTVLAFDYDSVSKDLVNMTTMSVLRYFPADNGRKETFVLVGNNEYVDNCVADCIRKISCD